MKVFVASIAFLLLATSAVAVDAQKATPGLRRHLAKPVCDDGTCRLSCSSCSPDSQECTTCLGGGDGGDPGACASGGASCKGGSVCCAGFTCVNQGQGDKICKADAVDTPSPMSYQDYYSGGTCNRNGPAPLADRSNIVLEFFAFGDTPYDDTTGAPPLFEGDEYACLQADVLPGMKALSNEVDFVAHIGDIKKGNEAGGDPYCTTDMFNSRRTLFSSLEPDLDFFVVVGDNEWNECAGYDEADNANIVKTNWRDFFSTPPFENFDRASLPSGAASPNVERDTLYPENFYFYYHNVAFFGVTEPSGDSSYNTRNRDWIQSKLNIVSPAAIVIFGHATLAGDAKSILPVDVPTLYIHGNGHPQQWCMQFPGVVGDMYMDLEVEAFFASPLQLSIVEKEGLYFFHAQEIDMGCST